MTLATLRTLWKLQQKGLPAGAPQALYFVLLEIVAGVRNLPIAPTIRFEIPIVESAA